MDKPHSKYPHVYAIVRFDLPVSENNPGGQGYCRQSAVVASSCGTRGFSTKGRLIKGSAASALSRSQDLSRHRSSVEIRLTHYQKLTAAFRHTSGRAENVRTAARVVMVSVISSESDGSCFRQLLRQSSHLHRIAAHHSRNPWDSNSCCGTFIGGNFNCSFAPSWGSNFK
jgi:hypothetical protein